MKVLSVYAHPQPTSFCHAVLEEFTAGLAEAGHTSRVVDLYGIGFDPVFRQPDFASQVDESIPTEILQQMDLRRAVVAAAGGPVRRALAGRVVRDKTPQQLARLIRSRMPKDVRAQQRQVAWADGLAFVAPVHFCQFPAILKGWIDRVFTYGFAFGLTIDGWHGDIHGRIPLLHHQRALIMTSTLFDQAAYDAGIRDSMGRLIDDWAFRYPGIQRVDHVYFYTASSAPAEVLRGYLQQARLLGRAFADPPSDVVPEPTPARQPTATTTATAVGTTTTEGSTP
jgi:NAD(P)H dehydrogenase (quinone)